MSARPSAAELLVKINGGEWEEQRAALEALGRIEALRGDPEMLDVAFRELENKDCHVRRAALGTMVRLAALPEEEASAADKSAGSDAQSCPRRFGNNAVTCLGKAISRLQDEDWGVRRVALSAVGELVQRGDAEAITAITAHFSDDDEDVRSAAATALGRAAAEGDDDAMAELVPLLDDDEEVVRKAAVRAYGLIAPLGHQDAIKRILAMAKKDEDDDVRKAAASALQRFRVPPSGSGGNTGGGGVGNSGGDSGGYAQAAASQAVTSTPATISAEPAPASAATSSSASAT